MSESHRFKIVYTKMHEMVLEDERRHEPPVANVTIRHRGEVSSEELDEIARLREIILETTTPEAISFTTT